MKKTFRTFTSSATFVAPAGVTSVDVYVTGEVYPSVTGGGQSTAFLTQGLPFGQVFAWGANSTGQLGDNTITSRSSPVAVVGSFYPFGQITSNPRGETVVALDGEGNAWGWGTNSNGQCGDGSTTNKSTPVMTVGGFKFSKVYSNTLSSLALTSSGVLYGWGGNQNGQLALGSVSFTTSPLPALGGFTFREIFLGSGNQAFGITPGNVLYGWGFNGVGQLGDGTIVDKSSPVAVLGGLLFKEVSVSDVSQPMTLGLTTSGAAYSWGENSSGSLGQNSGAAISISSPVAVVGGLTFAHVYASQTNSCYGLTPAGAAYAWGANNVGQLGDGTSTNRSSPVAVLGGLSFIQLFLGSENVYGLTAGGALWAWGENSFGSLGDGTVVNKSSPVAVLGGLTFQNVFINGGISGVTTAFGLTPGGSLYGWGINQAGGFVGDGTSTNRSSPVLVVGGLTAFQNAGTTGFTTLSVVPGTSYPIVVGPTTTAKFGSTPVGLGQFGSQMTVVY